MAERELSVVEQQMEQAGDCIAGMLGVAVTAMQDEDPFTEAEMIMAREAILRWHYVKDLARQSW